MAATIVSCRFIPRDVEEPEAVPVKRGDLTLEQVRTGIFNAYYVEAIRDGLTPSEAQEWAQLMVNQAERP